MQHCPVGYVKVRRFYTPHIHEENFMELFGKAVSCLICFENADAEQASLLAPLAGSAEAVEADLRASPGYSDWLCRNILKKAVANANFSVTFSFITFINGEEITELLDKERYGNSSRKIGYLG